MESLALSLVGMLALAAFLFTSERLITKINENISIPLVAVCSGLYMLIAAAVLQFSTSLEWTVLFLLSGNVLMGFFILKKRVISWLSNFIGTRTIENIIMNTTLGMGYGKRKDFARPNRAELQCKVFASIQGGVNSLFSNFFLLFFLLILHSEAVITRYEEGTLILTFLSASSFLGLATVCGFAGGYFSRE